ncbi:MAG: hypothetical protein E7591_07695 [Ruminococcaceae bacterium]|nr:hypothetical protein [Oscillospiraceae bacterium]
MSDHKKINEKEDLLYKEARSKMVNAIDGADYDEAIVMFKKLGSYRDSEELISVCRRKKEKLGEKLSTENVDWNLKYKELRFKKIKNIGLIILGAVLWAVVLILLFTGGPSTPTM